MPKSSANRSLKAFLCRRGASLPAEYAQDQGIAFDRCGKVVVSKRVDGAIMLGPNAFLSLGREAYGRFGFNFADVLSTVGFGGFWIFASRNLPAAVRETKTALSRKAFVMQAQQLTPELWFDDVVAGGRGVRAQAMDRHGALVDDFVISHQGRLVQVRNAPSPGATASMAIAEHIVTQSVATIGLTSRS